MKRSTSGRLPWLAAVAVIALARPAHAQGTASPEESAPELEQQAVPEVAPPEVAPPEVAPPDPAAEAQALFRRGLELGEQNRWAEALELFRRSRALVSRPSTVFNIGLALFRLGRLVQAIASFDEYLALTASETTDLRAEATRRRAEATQSLATLTLELTPESARLLVDGEEHDAEGSPRVIPLDPGRHVLRATADGYEERGLEISVLAAEATTRALTLDAIPVVPPEEPDPTPAEERPTTLVEDPIFWVVTVLAVGAAAAIGAGVAIGTSAPPSYGGSTGVVLLAL